MSLTGEFKLRVARRRMVHEQLIRHGIHDTRVLDVMGRLARHRFVDDVLAARAYSSNALPIGGGQTISHPRIVALMTQALALRGTEKVLEIGTGSGYQTAVLASLAREVYSLERIPALAERAAMRLRELGFQNVHLRSEAGLGWPEQAPFDAIVASAAAPEVPGRLLDQLGAGGRLVLPIGRKSRQHLMLLVRRGDTVTSYDMGSCRFVPMLGPANARAGAGASTGADDREGRGATTAATNRADSGENPGARPPASPEPPGQATYESL